MRSAPSPGRTRWPLRLAGRPVGLLAAAATETTRFCRKACVGRVRLEAKHTETVEARTPNPRDNTSAQQFSVAKCSSCAACANAVLLGKAYGPNTMFCRTDNLVARIRAGAAL